jgi:hypothetical protein
MSCLFLFNDFDINVWSALAGVFAVGGLCNFGRVYLMRVSGQNITAALRNNVGVGGWGMFYVL